MKNKITRNTLQNIIIVSVSMLFYLYFAWHDGVVICEDSPTYIYMSITREPLYPLLLAILRGLFGEGYLFITVVLQSILAAVAGVCIPLYLRKEQQISAVGAYLLTMIPLACSLLCRFAAKRASMYSNSILTEGIACSLFLIFIRFLLEYMLHKQHRPLLYAGTLSFLLISTRKQMYFTVVLLFLAVIYVNLDRIHIKKGILLAFLCVVAVLVSNKVFDNVYGYALRGTAHQHSGDNRFLATVVFYTAEREDGERITDPEAKELFYEIYDICESKEYLKHSVENTWKQRATHFGDSYDRIQIDTMWPAVERYVEEYYDTEDVAREKKVDEITQRITIDLLPAVSGKIFRTFADNLCSGFVTTVAKVHPVLIGYSVFIYAAYIAMLLYLGIYNRGSTAFLFAAVTLVSICLNVGLVSMVIFCQTRYTIYNMPLFYMSLLLMIKELYKMKKSCTAFRKP